MNTLQTIKVEVRDTEVRFQNSEDGSATPYQRVFVHREGDPYPSMQKAFIPKAHRDRAGKPEPFAAGWYGLDESRIFVGYGKVSMSLGGAMVPIAKPTAVKVAA